MLLPALVVLLVLCGCQCDTSDTRVLSDMKIALTSHYNELGHWQSEVEFVQSHRDSLAINKWQTEVEQRTEDWDDDNQVLRTIIHLKVPVAIKTRPGVPEGYERVEGVGVVKKSSEVKSLAMANKDCAQVGAYLMVIDSEAKLKYVNDFMNNSDTFKGASNDRDIWTGAQVVAGEWRTAQGLLLQTVPGFIWFTGRPVDGHCAVFAKHIQSHWDSNACASSGARLSYICEMPKYLSTK